MNTNYLKVMAQLMLNEEKDYVEVDGLPEGYLLGGFSNEVWVVDGNETCNLDAMPKVQRII